MVTPGRPTCLNPGKGRAVPDGWLAMWFLVGVVLFVVLLCAAPFLIRGRRQLDGAWSPDIETAAGYEATRHQIQHHGGDRRGPGGPGL
jgi:hypothetical protein